MKKIEDIPFNIWDDFISDGCLGKGEVQETSGYIEEYDVLTQKQKIAICQMVFDFIKTLDMTGVEVTLQGTDVCFKHLTHARLEALVKELQASGLQFEGVLIDFFSES